MFNPFIVLKMHSSLKFIVRLAMCFTGDAGNAHEHEAWVLPRVHHPLDY